MIPDHAPPPFPSLGRGFPRALPGWLALCLAATVAGCASLPPNAGRQPSQAFADTGATPLARQVRALAPAARPRTSGVRLLDQAETAYGSRLALIDAARMGLDLQYYSIHYDRSTEALMRKLQSAARRGVRIRLLLDDFNAAGDNAQVLRLDAEPNIEVRLFNPLQGPRASQVGRVLGSLTDAGRIQQRMHNKLFVADNAVAITGGRNLGDEYFGQGEGSNFLDLDVLAAGPVVRELSASFDRYWNDPLAYPVATLLDRQERERIEREAPESAGAESPPAAPDDGRAAPQEASSDPGAQRAADPEAVARDLLAGGPPLVWAPAILLADTPSKIEADAPGAPGPSSGPDGSPPADPVADEETVVDGLLQLLGQARQDLLIVSPYFVPGQEMLGLFTGLRARGVRIRVLTNSLASNDAPLAHAGYARWREPLLAAGVELYELRSQGAMNRRLFGSSPQSRASLHSKALVMDGRLLVVGSMNLDLRSKIQNTELGLVIRSQQLSSAARRSIEATLRDSYRVERTPEGLRWHAPEDDEDNAGRVWSQEPEAGLGLRLMIRVLGPLAPDELL